MTFKKCRNEGCEIIIEVRQTAEGWRPFLESGEMHQCQFSPYAKKQKAQEKDDHGNEGFGESRFSTAKGTGSEEVIKGEYVDHTAKGQSKVKIFSGSDITTEDQYNTFLQQNHGKIKTQGAQFQVIDSITYAIALYYEEITKQ